MLENILARIKDFVQGIISLDLIGKIQLVLGKVVEVVGKVVEVVAQIKDWLFGIVTKLLGG